MHRTVVLKRDVQIQTGLGASGFVCGSNSPTVGVGTLEPAVSK